MPLDVTRANVKAEAINTAFKNIGTPAGNGTAMPRGAKANLEPIAWEVFMAKHLSKIAKAREAKAIKAAIVAGVMFDHEKNREPAGTNRVVYDGEVVRIDLSVGTGGAGIDHPGYVASLLAAGVDPKLLTRLANKHATVTAAPHSFSASLVTG